MDPFFAVVALFVVLIDAQAGRVMAKSSQTETAKDLVGWVPNSPGRSTLNIVWSCLSVLLVCTYKCVHLNISSFEENQAGWHKTKLFGVRLSYWPKRPLVRKTLRKIKFMMIILIAPEVGVAMAVGEFLAARSELRRAKERFPVEELTLTLTHGFYSIMGGYAGARKYDSRRSTSERLHPGNSFGPKQSSSEHVSYSTVASIALQPVGDRSRNRDLEGEHVETESSAVKVTDEEQNMWSPLQGTPLAVDYKELYELNLSDYSKFPDYLLLFGDHRGLYYKCSVIVQ